MAGPISFKEAFGRAFLLVDYIEYAIAACAGGQRPRVEFYKHPFKSNMAVMPDPRGGPLWRMQMSNRGRLFTTRRLDDIFGVEAFGRINGAQFCC